MRKPFKVLQSRPSRHSFGINCQVVRLRDFRLVADRIQNLSVGGMLVGPADPVLTGEPLIVSFQLPWFGKWIDTEAKVARVVHGRRPGDRTRSLGIVFDEMQGLSRALIRIQLSGAPPVSPTFRPGRRDTREAERVLAVGSGWSISREGRALIRWFPRELPQR